MAKLRLEIITAERVVLADDVDEVIAPGVVGELGILPQHAPLLTTLKPGEMMVRKGGEDTFLAISGGFLEVLSDKVVILADAAERAEEIDIARAEEAKRRAQALLVGHGVDVNLALAEASFRRALTRLKVAERRRRRARA